MNQRIDRRRFLAVSGLAGLGLVSRWDSVPTASAAFGDGDAHLLASQAPLPKPFTTDLPKPGSTVWLSGVTSGGLVKMTS